MISPSRHSHRWMDGYWIFGVCLQGCDELGHHAGGPSEEGHEQHTDNESPDVTPPWYRCPGVMDPNQPSGPECASAAPRAKLGSTLDVSTHLLCLAWNHSFFPQWRIVIDSSEGRKRATLNNKLKLPGWDHFLFCLFFFFWGGLRIQPHIKWRNRTKWSTRTPRLGTCFFLFCLFFRRTQILAVVFLWYLGFVSLCDKDCSFAPLNFLWTRLQGKRCYPNTDRGSDSKVRFVLTHAGLFVLTCVCLHVLVSNLPEWLHDVVSTSECFYDFIFLSNSAAPTRRTAPETTLLF